MQFFKTRLALFALSCFAMTALFSCTSNEIGSSKDVNPETVYFDYSVWGDEELDNMTVKLQYRFAGPNGTTLLLENPSQVSFDGQVLKADSSKMSGAYYEINPPASQFAGTHTIVFTDLAGKKYTETFTIDIPRLKNELPKSISRSTDFELELEGLGSPARINVLVTDTAAFGKDIDRIDTVANSRILITKEELAQLKNGPVHLQLYQRDEKKLKEATKEGGSLTVSYVLKRELELKD